MATLRNQKFSWDNDDLNPKCKAVLDLLNDLVTHFRYLMEDTQSPLPKGHSKPCAKAIAKVRPLKTLKYFNSIFIRSKNRFKCSMMSQTMSLFQLQEQNHLKI